MRRSAWWRVKGHGRLVRAPARLFPATLRSLLIYRVALAALLDCCHEYECARSKVASTRARDDKTNVVTRGNKTAASVGRPEARSGATFVSSRRAIKFARLANVPENLDPRGNSLNDRLAASHDRLSMILNPLTVDRACMCHERIINVTL